MSLKVTGEIVLCSNVHWSQWDISISYSLTWEYYSRKN